MNYAKILLVSLFTVFTVLSSKGQFQNDSISLEKKHMISLDLDHLFRWTNVSSGPARYGLAYRYQLNPKIRLKARFNLTDETHFSTESRLAFTDTVQVVRYRYNNDPTYQVGLGFEYGKFYKRFYIFTGLELMFQHQSGSSETVPLYRFPTEDYYDSQFPFSVGPDYDVPISEMSPSLLNNYRLRKNSFGLGIPIGLTCRINERFEVTAQVILQAWLERGSSSSYIPQEGTNYNYNWKGESFNIGRFELTLTYRF